MTHTLNEIDDLISGYEKNIAEENKKPNPDQDYIYSQYLQIKPLKIQKEIITSGGNVT